MESGTQALSILSRVWKAVLKLWVCWVEYGKRYSSYEYVESSTYSSRILEYAMSSTRLNTTLSSFQSCCRPFWFAVGTQLNLVQLRSDCKPKRPATTLEASIIIVKLWTRLDPLAPPSACVRVFFPFILDIRFVGRTSRGHTGGRSHRISHPPSFCDACLNFSCEKDSAVPFLRWPFSTCWAF